MDVKKLDTSFKPAHKLQPFALKMSTDTTHKITPFIYQGFLYWKNDNNEVFVKTGNSIRIINKKVGLYNTQSNTVDFIEEPDVQDDTPTITVEKIHPKGRSIQYSI